MTRAIRIVGPPCGSVYLCEPLAHLREVHPPRRLREPYEGSQHGCALRKAQDDESTMNSGWNTNEQRRNVHNDSRTNRAEPTGKLRYAGVRISSRADRRDDRVPRSRDPPPVRALAPELSGQRPTACLLNVRNFLVMKGCCVLPF